MDTNIRILGLDGILYNSKIEAMFADFLLTKQISYSSHVGVGIYKHKTNQLIIDFLLRLAHPIAIELDIGIIRRNTDNIYEKRRRSIANGWKWLVISQDQIRHLCKTKNVEYWERLVSSANTA